MIWQFQGLCLLVLTGWVAGLSLTMWLARVPRCLMAKEKKLWDLKTVTYYCFGVSETNRLERDTKGGTNDADGDDYNYAIGVNG